MWMKTKMTRESGKLPMAGIPGRKWMTAASRTAEISPAGAGLLRAATTWSLRRVPKRTGEGRGGEEGRYWGGPESLKKKKRKRGGGIVVREEDQTSRGQ